MPGDTLRDPIIDGAILTQRVAVCMYAGLVLLCIATCVLSIWYILYSRAAKAAAYVGGGAGATSSGGMLPGLVKRFVTEFSLLIAMLAARKMPDGNEMRRLVIERMLGVLKARAYTL